MLGHRAWTRWASGLVVLAVVGWCGAGPAWAQGALPGGGARPGGPPPRHHLPAPPSHPVHGRAHLPLQSSQVATPIHRIRPGKRQAGPSAAPSVIYTPANILTAYNFGSRAGGAGQTIVLLEAYGDPSLSTDLATFDAQWGLPPANLNVYTVDGNPAPNSGWALETALDVEWAHAEAPAATLDVVEAANSSFQDLLGGLVGATSLSPNVVSMSWGAPESDYTADSCRYDGTATNCEAAFEAALQAAQRAGIVLLAAAGDNGAYDNGSTLSVNYPASSPEVIGVGGTTLTLSAGGGYGGETAWSSGGGGYSSLFPAPSYQPAGLPARGVPDAAFDANPDTGVYVYHSPSWYQVGGTSLGSPSWAAIVADSAAGTHVSLGQLYAVYGSAAYPGDLHDVTSGSNGYYSAGVGWDPVTGVGTPNVTSLLSAPAPAGLSLSPSSQSQVVAPGSAAAYSFTLSNTGVSGTVDLSATTSPALPAGWTVTVPSSVSAAAGQPVAVKLSVSAPAGATAGASFTTTLTATSGSLSASATATTTVLARGVTLSPGSATGSGAPGGSVSYSFTLSNTGNASDSFTLTAASSAGWSVSAAPNPVTLAPGAAQTVTLKVTIPPSAATGASDRETLTASDASGASASATASTTVAAQATKVSVTSIGYASQGPGLRITVALQNNLGQPVSGASVSIKVFLNGRAYALGTSTTGSNGAAAFTLNRAARGTYTTTVTGVTATGLTWDGSTPPNSYRK